MTITPRTCLWPLTGALCVSFALSMGLTYRSNTHCFAATCSENHSALQTRVQVAVWYLWLALSVTVFGFRSFKVWLRKLLNQQVRLFGTKHRISLSSILMGLWILVLYGIIVAIWWVEVHNWYLSRGPGMSEAAGLLAAISVTGQLSAISLGLTLTPVSRHSALGSFFKLTFTGTQQFHMMVSYLLISLVLIHALLYIYWAGYWKTWPADKRKLFPVYNPEFDYDEVYPGNKSVLGRYRASLVFTGAAAAFILLMVVLTSLRIIRRKWFKVFYWVHATCLFAIFVACLHSSTVFYCIAPGIFMWLLDKIMRVYELYGALYGTISPLGKGWYLLSCPLPRSRLEGCACSSPVARFYIYHTDSAIPVRELHPFTTTTHLALQDAITDPTQNSLHIGFLFRRHGGETPFVSVAPVKKGWTGKLLRLLNKYRPSNSDPDITRRMGSRSERAEWRMGQRDSFALLHLESEPAEEAVSRGSSPDVEAVRPRRKNKAELLMDNASVPISLRLEGPFFTPANPSHYHTVVCLVEGAGISGALAIVSAFQELERYEHAMRAPRYTGDTGNTAYDMTALSSHIYAEKAKLPTVARVWKRCLVVWVVKEEDYIELPGLHVAADSALEVRIHATAKDVKAISYYAVLDELLVRDGEMLRADEKASVWVYISGSEKFVGKVEKACKDRQARGVEWTTAEIAV